LRYNYAQNRGFRSFLFSVQMGLSGLGMRDFFGMFDAQQAAAVYS
jgi:hypothetical protein